MQISSQSLKVDEKLKPDHSGVTLVLSRLQLTSQDHTPQVIQRALEKHHMEDVSHRDFSLCQMLLNGKGSCHVLGCDQVQEPRMTKTIFSLKTSFRAVRLLANLLCVQVSHVTTDFFRYCIDIITSFKMCQSTKIRVKTF